MKKEVLGVKAPTKECTDMKCPFHGKINVKNELFKGRVVKKDIGRSATIEWFRSQYIPKYERYEIKRSRMRTHNPACIDAEVGQEVLVARTRPLSKTKNHVIFKIIDADKKTNVSLETLETETPKVKKAKEVKEKVSKTKEVIKEKESENETN